MNIPMPTPVEKTLTAVALAGMAIIIIINIAKKKRKVADFEAPKKPRYKYTGVPKEIIDTVKELGHLTGVADEYPTAFKEGFRLSGYGKVRVVSNVPRLEEALPLLIEERALEIMGEPLWGSWRTVGKYNKPIEIKYSTRLRKKARLSVIAQSRGSYYDHRYGKRRYREEQHYVNPYGTPKSLLRYWKMLLRGVESAVPTHCEELVLEASE